MNPASAAPDVYLSYRITEGDLDSPIDAEWLIIEQETDKILARFTQPDLAQAFIAGYEQAARDSRRVQAARSLIKEFAPNENWDVVRVSETGHPLEAFLHTSDGQEVRITGMFASHVLRA